MSAKLKALNWTLTVQITLLDQRRRNFAKQRTYVPVNRKQIVLSETVSYNVNDREKKTFLLKYIVKTILKCNLFYWIIRYRFIQTYIKIYLKL